MIKRIFKIEWDGELRYFKDEITHRDKTYGHYYLPCIISTKSDLQYGMNQIRHRPDGPAIIYDQNKSMEYWEYGQQVYK